MKGCRNDQILQNYFWAGVEMTIFGVETTKKCRNDWVLKGPGVEMTGYRQNVPKPKHTQVKMYLRGNKIYSSEIKTNPSGVKTYPVCSQNVPMIFVLLQFVYKLIEIMYSSSWRFLTRIYFEFALHD